MAELLLVVDDLVVDLPGTGRVLDGVSLHLQPGETMALVGSSGCGKTTLARTVLGLQQPVSGRVRIAGHDLIGARGATLKTIRRTMQAVFQDPGGSINDRMRIGDIVGEAAMVLTGLRGAALRDKVLGLLESVDLDPSLADSWPHRLSGGQKQRVAMARAIAVEPALLICDEPTSALDVSVQARVLQLLGELQRSSNMAMLMVTHDLAVAGEVCDRVAVLDEGRIVEDRPVDDLLRAPEHPVTCALVEASA